MLRDGMVVRRSSDPRLAFVCGREPSYVRNRLLARGLAGSYSVSVIASNRRGYVGRFASVLPRLVRAAHQTDLIVAGFLGQPIAIIASRLLRKPVLLDAFISVYDTLCLDRRTVAPGSPTGRLAFALDREAVQAATLSLVDTACQRRFFAETLGEPIDRFQVHYVGPDLDARPGAAGDVPGGHHRDTPVVVLHYGSYLPLHGVEVIVEAAHCLRNDPSIRFHLVGRGRRRSAVDELARSLKLPNVEFIDWLDPSELSREIRRATIGLGGHFANNSKARRVIAGKTYQLLAAAVPTIVGDCLANREIFTPGRDVEMVPMADPAALAGAISALAHDPSRREQLGRAGTSLMRDRFAPSRVAADLRQAVETALDRA